MNSSTIVSVSPSLTLSDIYYVLFRHKWKILLCTFAGAIAAGFVYKLNPKMYVSEAKLFIRYVISDHVLGPGTTESAKSPDRRGETIMNSEEEILTSVDLARQVASAVGPEKILSKYGGGTDLLAATAVVQRNITVTVPPSSSVIHVAFKHPDPELAQVVLREIVARYLKLHVETHTGNGMLGDMLTQETDQLHAQLAQTEDELRKATTKAGVVSVADAKKTYADQMAGIRRDLFAAEADLAEKTSVLQALTHQQENAASSAAAPAPALDQPIPPEILDEFRSVSTQYSLLQRMEQELLTQFTPESARVAEVHAQLVAADERRTKLLQKYPRLNALDAAPQSSAPGREALDPAALASQIIALKARIGVLNTQMNMLRGETLKLEQMEGTIADLQRRKDLEESNYRYYSTSLEQARINETIGNGRVSNIVEIQKPSPASADTAKLYKLVAAVFGGITALGLAWAFFVEMYLDRTVKRPIDLERMLGAPMFISIPAVGRRALRSGRKGGAALGPAESTPPALLEYHATLRDRLIGYFETVNLTHKPKLVAVTGLHRRAGVTTTAAGLARSLSETGEGNVLLVNMTVNHGSTQQFSNGQPVCGIDELLHARSNAQLEENLYVVAEHSNSDRLSRNMPQRFSKLVPKLKASDFDYIIFDMPPISQISITPRLAGYMDMVLLVVESEHSDRDVVQRATRLLADTRAHVGVVLNKTRNYVPTRLQPSLVV